MDLSAVTVSVCRMVISGQRDALSEVLPYLAASDGRAAARAIKDVGRSDFPRDQVLAAVTLLRASHQKYLDEANRPRSRREIFQQGYGVDVFLSGLDTGRRYGQYKGFGGADPWEEARFYAGVIALALSGVYKMLGDMQQQMIWRDRSRSDFLASYRLIPKLYPAEWPFERSLTTEDVSEYRRRCNELLEEYDHAYDSLASAD